MKRFSISLLALAGLVLTGCTPQALPQIDESFPISLSIDHPSLGPRLAQNGDLTNLSWMERSEDGPVLRFARYQNGKWIEPTTVVTDAKMFVNWADLPAVTPTQDDSLLAHWLRYSADGTYTYDVLLARSDDGGTTWSDPVKAHDDGTKSEHGFVSVYPAGDAVGLVWLDGRFTPEKGMTLRSATINETSAIHNEAELDSLVCDCCQTDVAVGSQGALLVYRNRSNDETRDIYISRNENGAWQPGVAVADDGWVIDGCPVNGPAIAADGDNVVVVWFTAAGDRPTVKLALSKNAGKSFSEPAILSNRRVIGHVDVTMIDTHSFAVSWMESDRQRGYNIRLQGRTFDGQAGEIQTVGKTSLMQTVPQLARYNDELLMAWSDVLSDATQVVAVRMTLLGYYD